MKKLTIIGLIICLTATVMAGIVANRTYVFDREISQELNRQGIVDVPTTDYRQGDFYTRTLKKCEVVQLEPHEDGEPRTKCVNIIDAEIRTKDQSKLDEITKDRLEDIANAHISRREIGERFEQGEGVTTIR